MKQLKTALDTRQKRSIDVELTNTDRSFGTIFGSEITKKYQDTLEEDTFIVKCKGAGGQSFGAFIPKGLTLELVGERKCLYQRCGRRAFLRPKFRSSGGCRRCWRPWL